MATLVRIARPRTLNGQSRGPWRAYIKSALGTMQVNLPGATDEAGAQRVASEQVARIGAMEAPQPVQPAASVAGGGAPAPAPVHGTVMPPVPTNYARAAFAAYQGAQVIPLRVEAPTTTDGDAMTAAEQKAFAEDLGRIMRLVGMGVVAWSVRQFGKRIPDPPSKEEEKVVDRGAAGCVRRMAKGKEIHPAAVFVGGLMGCGISMYLHGEPIRDDATVLQLHEGGKDTDDAPAKKE